MSRKILLACYETPGWGGAATIAYLLFERMQRDGIASSYINLVARGDAAFLRDNFGPNFSNPKHLRDVHTCNLKPPLWRGHENLASAIQRQEPDTLIGFGFVAARLLQLAAPKLPVVMISSGARRLGELIESGAVKDFMGFCRAVEAGVVFPMPGNHPERQAAENADLVILHSPLVRAAFDHLIPSAAGHTYANTISVADFVFAEAEDFAHLSRPWEERDVDILFVASDWNRPDKNYRLVRKIVAQKPGMRVHIVGKADRPCKGARHHGVIASRAEVYQLLGRAKALVCPSLADAAPGILFESAALGCNIIASQNCGNWQLCNEQLLAETSALAPWLEKIALAQPRRYPDHRKKFLGGYGDLIATLQAL